MMEDREPAETTPAQLTFEVPVRVASTWRRALAAALDFFLVGAAFTIFAAIAFRFTGAILPRTRCNSPHFCPSRPAPARKIARIAPRVFVITREWRPNRSWMLNP